jgi:hypothetical protein
VVDIVKLIKDETCFFQGVSKELLLECLENLEPEVGEENSKALVVQPTTQFGLKKRRVTRASDPMDVKSLHRSTRLNKNLDGFKATSLADPEAGDSSMYVGRFDRDDAVAPPSSLQGQCASNRDGIPQDAAYGCL